MKIEKHTKLKVERYPILVTYRKNPSVSTGHVAYYWNVYTGKKSFNLDDVKEEGKEYQIVDKTNAVMYGVSIQYDEENGMIAFIDCKLDASCNARLKEESPRKWEVIEISYYTKNKEFLKWDRPYYYSPTNIWTEDSDYEVVPFSLNNAFNCNLAKKCILINSSHMVSDKEGNQYWYQYDLLKPFRDWYGEIVPISGNKMIVLDTIEMLNIFSKYKTPNNKGNIANNKKLQELLKYKLPEISKPKEFKELEVIHDWRARTYIATNENIHKFAVIQKVPDSKEPLCVVRTFFKSPYSDTILEGGRIYVSKTEVISCKRLDKDTFMYQKLLDKPENWNFPIENFNKEEVEDTKLEYFGEILDEIDYDIRGVTIWSFLKEPMTEMLYKLPDLKELVQMIFKMSVIESPVQIIESIFGKINKKEKNIYKVLGLNKYQLEKMIPLAKKYLPLFSIYTYYGNKPTPIQKLKHLLAPMVTEENTLDVSSIASVDNETTDWAINVIEKVFEKYGKRRTITTTIKNGVISDWSKLYNSWEHETEINDVIYCFENTIRIYNISVAKKMEQSIFDNLKKCIQRTITDYWGRERKTSMKFPTAYVDFLNMIDQCEFQSRVKPYFENIEELSNMHEMMVDIINSKKDEIEQRKWDSRKSSWLKWEFKGETMSAIAPLKPDMLAEEGITLHHCVRSYIQKVLNGTTNIMFIRMNEELDKPFYTVEVDNNGIIQQVHGFGNCNATPEVEKFVKKWCKEKKLTTDHFNKVR